MAIHPLYGDDDDEQLTFAGSQVTPTLPSSGKEELAAEIGQMQAKLAEIERTQAAASALPVAQAQRKPESGSSAAREKGPGPAARARSPEPARAKSPVQGGATKRSAPQTSVAPESKRPTEVTTAASVNLRVQAVHEGAGKCIDQLRAIKPAGHQALAALIDAYDRVTAQTSTEELDELYGKHFAKNPGVDPEAWEAMKCAIGAARTDAEMEVALALAVRVVDAHCERHTSPATASHQPLAPTISKPIFDDAWQHRFNAWRASTDKLADGWARQFLERFVFGLQFDSGIGGSKRHGLALSLQGAQLPVNLLRNPENQEQLRTLGRALAAAKTSEQVRETFAAIFDFLISAAQSENRPLAVVPQTGASSGMTGQTEDAEDLSTPRESKHAHTPVRTASTKEESGAVAMASMHSKSAGEVVPLSASGHREIINSLSEKKPINHVALKKFLTVLDAVDISDEAECDELRKQVKAMDNPGFAEGWATIQANFSAPGSIQKAIEHAFKCAGDHVKAHELEKNRLKLSDMSVRKVVGVIGESMSDELDPLTKRDREKLVEATKSDPTSGPAKLELFDAMTRCFASDFDESSRQDLAQTVTKHDRMLTEMYQQGYPGEVGERMKDRLITAFGRLSSGKKEFVAFLLGLRATVVLGLTGTDGPVVEDPAAPVLSEGSVVPRLRAIVSRMGTVDEISRVNPKFGAFLRAADECFQNGGGPVAAIEMMKLLKTLPNPGVPEPTYREMVEGFHRASDGRKVMFAIDKAFELAQEYLDVHSARAVKESKQSAIEASAAESPSVAIASAHSKSQSAARVSAHREIIDSVPSEKPQLKEFLEKLDAANTSNAEMNLNLRRDVGGMDNPGFDDEAWAEVQDHFSGSSTVPAAIEDAFERAKPRTGSQGPGGASGLAYF
jgi:hypothetical protein